MISKFIQNAKEAEVDAVSDGKNVLIGAILEHVEKAGIHSGDATMRIPAEGLSSEVQSKIIDYTQRIAKALNIVGPFNAQYIVKAGDVLVIECNLRASRSMPFVSKMNGVNLLDAGAEAVLGHSIENYLKVSRLCSRSESRSRSSLSCNSKALTLFWELKCNQPAKLLALGRISSTPIARRSLRRATRFQWRGMF